MASTSDKYANVITEVINMSAANTLTFEEVQIGLSLFDKAGILISRIEYEPTGGTVGEMTAALDSITLAVTTSNSLSNLTPTQAAIVHRHILRRSDFGTAGSGQMVQTPFTIDLSTLPGGGLLITPKPWYIAMDSSGLASAGGAYVRFYFTVMKLQPAEYFELLETRTFFG